MSERGIVVTHDSASRPLAESDYIAELVAAAPTLTEGQIGEISRLLVAPKSSAATVGMQGRGVRLPGHVQPPEGAPLH
jgi:hypothetical protein